MGLNDVGFVGAVGGRLVTWTPLRAVAEGDLQPCGESPDGSHLEFFTHPATAAEMLALKHVTLRDRAGHCRRYHVSLSPTPRYANGDTQIVLKAAA